MSTIPTKQCKIYGCERPGKTNKNGKVCFVKGFCMMHYERVRSGEQATVPTVRDRRHAIIVGSIAKIPVGLNAKDGYAIVDATYAYLDRHQWSSSHGYAHTRIGGKLTLMHHLVSGKPSKGYVVDHINRDILDNRSSNLRVVTMNENLWNTGAKVVNTSGYKNIHFVKDRPSMWCVSVRRNNTVIFSGTFRDIDKAVEARDRAIAEYAG